jgi:hypothetical protein
MLTLLSQKAVETKKSDTQSTTAGKVLIPHAAWSCGMPDGIPIPESGIKVFDAEMKLSQLYDLGKTQYGQRQVLVVEGGTLKGPKLNNHPLFWGGDAA